MKILTHTVQQKRLWLISLLPTALLAIAISASMQSCATLNALAGLSRIQFKLGNVQQVRLAGINIANIHSASDLSIADGLNLLHAFSSGQLPLTFTLGLDAKNPNPKTAALNAVQITDLPWRLLVDGTQTITGNIAAPVSIPNGGTTEVIPLQVSIDLRQFFKDKAYNDLLNLALSLAGQGGATHLQLLTQPTMSTPIGSMQYPSEISVVNTEFRN